MNKYNKYKFILTYCAVVGLLAIIRHVFEIKTPLKEVKNEIGETINEKISISSIVQDTIIRHDANKTIKRNPTKDNEEAMLKALGVNGKDSIRLFLPEIYSPVTYLHSYSACFPDINPVQLKAAIAMGIEPVASREEAHQYVKSHNLVNITNSPYYVVDPLTHSTPYLVPECQDLLNTICISFIDSLQSKGLPPHLPIITSVLRTSKDIKKLQVGNVNSTTNSCHCYGTTVDITYNRFYPVTGNNKNSRKNVERYNEQMKKILAEVLLDLRMQGRCYVKYEFKQACFHLTIRPTIKPQKF